MILYGCGEPIPALKTLGKYVRSIHCKDATWSDQPGKTWGAEVALGKGAVDFAAYLRTLNEIGYTGPLTIEREIPQEPVRQKAEIAAAIETPGLFEMNAPRPGTAKISTCSPRYFSTLKD